MRIRFDETELIDFANRYEYQSNEILTDISKSAKKKKYLTREEFIRICAWKTPRSKPKVASNHKSYIKEITNISLTTQSDQLRIEILTILSGVGWPTASTILHFCHTEEFPILDFRALYSLGYDSVPKKYNYQFWKEYTDYCKNLSKKLNLDLRTIDRGLWQYSKENQRKK
ncbi:MAG: hypothetical protein DHS20C18_05700 [Saprospiraceae bacterium]|nr:MAG: hypothetical protein DHS20C18_05700 [Saprospiraceae bacterium]